MEFRRQPQGVLMVRSGVIYSVFDNNAKSNGFSYELIVQVWRGPLLANDLGGATPTSSPPAGATAGDYVVADVNVQGAVEFPNYNLDKKVFNSQKIIYDGTDWFATDGYILRKFPNKDGIASYDISRLLQAYFRDLEYNLPLETTANLTANVDVSATYWDGLKSNPDPPEYANPSPILAQFGYHDFREDINQVIVQESDGFLTDIPEVTQPDNGYMSLFIRHDAKNSLTKKLVVLNLEPPQVGFQIPVTTGVPTKNDETLLRFGVGRQDLLDAGFAAVGTNYSVSCADSSGVTIPGTATMIYHQADCSKYKPHKVDFINSYGVWDRVWMFGNATDSIEVYSNQAMRYSISDPSNDHWKQGDGQFVLFDKEGRDSITLNTGWLKENFNPAIRQLFLAERVVVDGYSAILKDKQFTMQTHMVDKLINYTLTFEFAFTAINTVS